ncbi:MAG TPA: 3-deoxy-7-phosphoheptulonate synthase, partial [Planctomycetes bacterium]|nr:3-deoxy-7-phosphoheptulonate synthase [Planctomycetota bacterium]
MIVVMKRGATQAQVDHMVARVEQLGLKAHVIYGTERTVIAAVGDKRDEHRSSLESGPGVAEVVPILAPYKVASLEVKPERTVVRVGPLSVGNGHLGVIAGPCAVENRQQTVA